MNDLALMERAIRLAERGRGRTSPNPMVGAVVVDSEGVIVGDGYHERAGQPHAEVRALDAAGAESEPGACSGQSFRGRQPDPAGRPRHHPDFTLQLHVFPPTQ